MDLPSFRELPPERRPGQRAQVLAGLDARPRRRVLAVAAAAAVLVATPALALHRQVVDFFSAEPAPERIQLDFDSLRARNEEWRQRGDAAVPPITPEGTARQVLTVTLDGEQRPMWVVPTKEGRFCSRLHFVGSCRMNREHPISVGGLATRDGDGFQWIHGDVVDPRVEELELVYQDGARTKLPYVWVSPPVDAGFYALEVPAERQVAGGLPVGLVGLDDDGDVVARLCLRLAPEELARSAASAREICERPR